MRKLKRILPILGAALLLCGVPGCDKPNQSLIENAPLISKHFKDGFGREVELRRRPTRVVSLASNITETMFAIGAGGSLVARSHLCNHPGDALFLPEITVSPQFDLPKVVEFNPDLILASSEIHDTRIAPFFDKYRIPILFQRYDNVEDVLKGIEVVGQIMERESAAKHLCDSLRRIGNALADSTKGQIQYSTAMIVSIDPLAVAGGLSFQSDLMHKAGARNVFADRKERYPTITAEQLIQAAPEYLLLPSRDDQVYAKLIEQYPAIHLNLPAAIQKHVYQLEPELIVRPGPRIMEGLAYLIRVLHARINVDAVFEPDGGAVDEFPAE